MEKKLDLWPEIIAAQIGCCELMEHPTYPDSEDRCMTIVLSMLGEYSQSVRHSEPRGERARMVKSWRTAAKRVVSCLRGRGVGL